MLLDVSLTFSPGLCMMVPLSFFMAPAILSPIVGLRFWWWTRRRPKRPRRRVVVVVRVVVWWWRVGMVKKVDGWAVVLKWLCMEGEAL